MRTAKAVGMEMLFEPGHTGVGIKQSQNWKIHAHQYTKFALLVLLSYEWTQIESWLRQAPGPGRKRTVNLREIMNAILYLNRTGCQWRMLPHDLPYWQHVAYYFYKWLEDGTIERVNHRLCLQIRSCLG